MLIGEVHDCLPRRVPSAHDDYLLAVGVDRLASTGAVVDAAAEQLLKPVDVEPAPLDPGCNHRNVRGDLDAVARLDAHASLRARAASPDPAKELQLGTKALGLPCGQP